MTDLLLFPRLTRAAGRRILQASDGEGRDPALARAAGEAVAAWGATGGRRVTTSELLEMRESLVAIGRDCGYERARGRPDHAAFDARCTIWFGETDLIPVGEGLRDDIWSWLGVCLLPDLVARRFPGQPDERFLGGPRNVFQRHWMRARAFDLGLGAAGRWSLVETLGEDAMVQILERPSISSQPELARAIGQVWLERSRTEPAGGMQDVARAAIRALRILDESRGLAALEPELLAELVQGVFEDAEAGSGVAPQPDPPPRRRSLLGALLGAGRG